MRRSTRCARVPAHQRLTPTSTTICAPNISAPLLLSLQDLFHIYKRYGDAVPDGHSAKGASHRLRCPPCLLAKLTCPPPTPAPVGCATRPPCLLASCPRPVPAAPPALPLPASQPNRLPRAPPAPPLLAADALMEEVRECYQLPFRGKWSFTVDGKTREYDGERLLAEYRKLHGLSPGAPIPHASPAFRAWWKSKKGIW